MTDASQDHFALILNQPAGEIAQCIVEYTVNLVTKAWDNPGMPTDQVTEPVLRCLFHPDFHDGHCELTDSANINHWLTST